MNTLHTFCLLLVAVLVCANDLPGMLPIDKKTVTASGVSSGGAFAMQLHVAYSSIIQGVGYFAAPPYRCAGDSGQIGALECMEVPILVQTSKLVSDAKQYEQQGSVDALRNLTDDRVWVFSGTNDYLVNQGTVKKIAEFYQTFISDESAIKTTYNVPASHAWITDNSADNSCSFFGAPYINNCQLDGAGEILNHVLFQRFNITAKPRTTQKADNLFKFDQTPYGDSSIGVLSYGYVYIPTACQVKKGLSNATCRLHISLHGCAQNADTLQTTFVTHVGLNDWAESNNIVVLYPQAASVMISNPQGCFDWWGYTNSNFANQQGPQMKAVRAMIGKLLGEK